MKRSLLVMLVIVSAFFGAVLGITFALKYTEILSPAYRSIEERQASRLVNQPFDTSSSWNFRGVNFEAAATAVTPAVVHIRTVYGNGEFSLNPLDHYFSPQARASGSGVIISDDGYIVTNYHVIEDASRIEVVLSNNQRFYAKLFGKDHTTDLALLKINARNLPFVRYGDSDIVNPGQWVLAIGNPFDLNSTVTAGIVSAKARNIRILQDRNQLQVESFIQTDAAINPGNSGGALVNLRGELIGINSAIATSTGNYQGYSFAIPVALVKKVMDDLLEFGEVQRGLLGVQIADVTADLAERKNLDVIRGVHIDRVNRGSAAEESGLKAGDIILAINDREVNGVSELQEWVARKRPGQSVDVTYRRDGSVFTVKTILKNFEGLSEVKKKEVHFDIQGAVFEDLSYKELSNLSIDGGVMVKSLQPGKWKRAGITEGFIISHIDKLVVENVEDLNRILAQKRGGILIEGFLPDGSKGVFGVDWAPSDMP